MNTFTATLPWGPSMNSYWCKRGRITFISKAGRAFRKDVETILIPFRGRFGGQRLFVSITAFPPDRRTRDLDNLLKPLLDAMQHAKLFDDDSQIDRLLIERGNVIGKPGQLQVTIESIP